MAGMPAPKQDNQRLTKKLNKLVSGRVQSTIAERAGVSTQMFSHYLSGGAPRPAVALRIARALEVDPVWLVDEDDQRLDPPPVEPSGVCAIPDKAFVDELRRRYLEQAVKLDDYLEDFEGTGWLDVALALSNTPMDQTPPAGVDRPLQLAQFSPLLIDHTIRPYLIDGWIHPTDKLSPPQLADRVRRIMTRYGCMGYIRNYLALQQLMKSGQVTREEAEKTRLEALEELRKIAASGEGDFETFAEVDDAGGVNRYVHKLLADVKTEIIPELKAKGITDKNEIGQAVLDRVGEKLKKLLMDHAQKEAKSIHANAIALLLKDGARPDAKELAATTEAAVLKQNARRMDILMEEIRKPAKPPRATKSKSS